VISSSAIGFLVVLEPALIRLPGRLSSRISHLCKLWNPKFVSWRHAPRAEGPDKSMKTSKIGLLRSSYNWVPSSNLFLACRPRTSRKPATPTPGSRIIRGKRDTPAAYGDAACEPPDIAGLAKAARGVQDRPSVSAFDTRRHALWISMVPNLNYAYL
jgi:hypothetical protein